MENMGMFIVGAIIFGLYMAGYLFMIKYANDGQRRDMARDDRFEYYQRHNQPNPADYDGMGNFSRFPVNKEHEALKNARKNRMDRDWKSRKKEKVD